jgi:hypothetical protein
MPVIPSSETPRPEQLYEQYGLPEELTAGATPSDLPF